jgi:hypothetical protein
MKNAIAIVVFGAVAAVLLWASSSPRADIVHTTPQREIDWRSTMDCASIEVWLCMWGKGFGYYDDKDPRKPKDTSARFKLQDAAFEQCSANFEVSPLRKYTIEHENAIPRDLGFTQQTLERCKRCKARYGTPGGCPKKDDAAASGGYGGRTYGGSTYGRTPAHPHDKTFELARCFEGSVQDRVREGYYVKNANLYRHAQTALGWVMPWDESKGGRCGEYGAWGQQWIKPCVDRTFPGAIIDDITVEERTTTRTKYYSDYADAMFEQNHRATRLVLPDGRRFVVDYWDGIGQGGPKMITQTEWIEKWRTHLGKYDGIALLSDDEVALKRMILNDGLERGFKQFRIMYKTSRLKGDPEIWIRSWQREPW